MAVVSTLALKNHLSTEELNGRLENTCSIKLEEITQLDLNVYKVTLADKRLWVARVFKRPLEEIKQEAHVLTSLNQMGFPAEKCVGENPAFAIGSELCVLLTQFAPGNRPERNRKTFHRLGSLLGQLHSLDLPLIAIPRGGAWHHLSTSGSLTEELAAAIRGLEGYWGHAPTEQQDPIKQLINQLRAHNDLEDLPKSLVHPDFVSSNVIEDTATSEWTIVDWTGVGVGPRILSLGFLLYAAAARGKLVLVDEVMSAYGSQVTLEPGEMDRLRAAIWVRPFTIACWDVFSRGKDASEVVKCIDPWVESAEKVAARVRVIVGKVREKNR